MEVRYEDQQQINEFGRLNHRLHEVQADLKTVRRREPASERASGNRAEGLFTSPAPAAGPL